jgi:hypothetical protein
VHSPLDPSPDCTRFAWHVLVLLIDIASY